MFKKLILAALAVAALGVTLATPVFATTGPTSLVVDDDGLAGLSEDGLPDCTDGFSHTTDARVFQKIQDAVNAALPGYDIFVCPGQYNESVVVNTSVQLWGANNAGVADTDCSTRLGESTVTGVGDWALTINADGVTVDGLRFANTPAGGVRTNAANSGFVIANNRFDNNGNGLQLLSSGALETSVVGNCFSDNNNSAAGSGITSAGPLSNAWIKYNGFRAHRVGGINLDGSANAISGLDISYNRGTNDKSFALLKTVSSTLLFGNHVVANDEISVPASAFRVYGASHDLSLRYNIVAANNSEGILVTDTAYNILVKGNRIRYTTDGISILSSAAGAAKVQGNKLRDVTGNALNAGALSNGNTFVNNRATGVAQFHCVDASSGTGTGGTANTWTHNRGHFASPSEICS